MSNNLGYYTKYSYAEGKLAIKVQQNLIAELPFDTRKSAFDFVKANQAGILKRVSAIMKEKGLKIA